MQQARGVGYDAGEAKYSFECREDCAVSIDAEVNWLATSNVINPTNSLSSHIGF